MSLARVIRAAREESRLISALLELTYRCNLDCFICYNDVGLRGEPLSRERYLELLSDLAEMQVLYLTLSGGEPLAHPLFFDLGRRARELGFVVRVKSNGHALRGRLAHRLRDEVDPFVVEISLHGARPETHDRQTRVEGSFDRLMDNLEGLRGLGLRLKLNCPLTAWNEGEVGEIMGIADRLGVPLQIDPQLTPRDDGDQEPLTIAPSREGFRRLLKLQKRRTRPAGGDRRLAPLTVGREADAGIAAPAATVHCGAGTAGIAVDPFGNVYPCVQWRSPVGSLHRESIRDIWSRSEGLAEVRGWNARAKRELDELGELGRLMAFCPGLAQMTTGDPLQLGDQALDRARLVRREGGPER